MTERWSFITGLASFSAHNYPADYLWPQNRKVSLVPVRAKSSLRRSALDPPPLNHLRSSLRNLLAPLRSASIGV